MKRRPVALIIRDGWGLNPRDDGNAVFAAHTPNIDRYMTRYPWTRLACCGEAVGLPDGYQGSSEVGHLNMGAGRVVIQELKRIDDALRDGELFLAPGWLALMANWKRNRSRLHLMGLLQDEGVHAHQEHLFKIMRRARAEFPDGEIILHPFLDGRDTPPRSSPEYLGRLDIEMRAVGGCRIGTVMGRYYAMDRSRNFTLTDLAYHGLTQGVGRAAASAVAAVRASYASDRTPDDQEMSDEYIPCHVLNGYDGMRDGDSAMHTNYRQDRAIQLAQAFVSDAYAGSRRARPNVMFLGFTRYWNEFNDYLLGAMDAAGGMEMLLGEVISKAGLRQIRIAETQKFRHVTSFFNGKSTQPYPGEDQVEIPGRFDPALFASHPEMDAPQVTDELLRRLADNPYAFIVANYANCDMVGHTGVFDAARRAVEVVDACVGRLVPRLLELDAHILIAADHGNAEQMVDYTTGMVKTSHTLNDVACLYVARDSVGASLLPSGKLSDLAVTALHLLELPVPREMSADNLIVGMAPWRRR